MAKPTPAHGAVAGALSTLLASAVALAMRALGAFPAVRTSVAIASATALLLAGIAAGAAYARVARTPTIPSAMLFGLVPVAFAWLVVAPLGGAPIGWGFGTGAIALSLLFGCVIWGGLLGGLLRARELRDSDVVQPAPRRLSRGSTV